MSAMSNDRSNDRSNERHEHGGPEEEEMSGYAADYAARDYAVYARSRGLPEQIPRALMDGTRFDKLSKEEQEILTRRLPGDEMD